MKSRVEIMKACFENVCKASGALVMLFVLAACASTGRQLMPAPNLYTQTNAPELFTDLPPELQNNQVDLLFLTDRAPETDENGNLVYGYERSRSAAFGSAIVSIQPEMSWEDLEQASVERERSEKLTLELTSITELGRFQETPVKVVTIDGHAQEDPEDLRATRETGEAFRREMLRRLALAPKNEVVYEFEYEQHVDLAAESSEDRAATGS